jgi:tellurite resistance protein TehA-like permease
MAQRHDDDEHPPAPRRPGRRDDFVPQMLANAAGTLLAATVLYLYGVAVGAIRANWRLLAPIIVAAIVGVLFLVKLKIDDWIDERFKGPGLRRLVARNVLSSLYGVPVFALIVLGLYFWSDRGLPPWAYLVTVFGLGVLVVIVQRIWRLRRRGFTARTKTLD